MPVTRELFETIKQEYGDCSSWAIWKEAVGKAKEGVSDLSIFDLTINGTNLNIFNKEIFLIGLNISKSIDPPFSNFHSSYPYAQDYKLRYALKGTPLWGAYMTDILKNFEERDSSKVAKYIKNYPETLDSHFINFEREMKHLGVTKPLLFAFGGLTHNILKCRYQDSFRIIKLMHYSNKISKEKYREHVLEVLKTERLF